MLVIKVARPGDLAQTTYSAGEVAVDISNMGVVRWQIRLEISAHMT